jgi:two-component system cell cycle response regulator DivK
MRRPRVLLVDDFPDNREMYALYLEYAGFEVAEAATGYEALAQAFAQAPDLIVMDLSLPGLDGWEATRRLKRDPRTKQIPILALTGHALEGFSQGARDAGCDAFVTKPCLPEELAVEIRALLEATASPSESGAGGHHETQG